MIVLLCFGTRPELIKIAPVYHALKVRNIKTVLLSSGQHKELLIGTQEIFNITADFDLNIMSKNQSLNSIVANISNEIDYVFDKITPDLVLVQGDTTSAMAIALCAFNRKISVGHIEAGLRTHDVKSPFPEELNRQLIARLAKWHFTPTESAKNNLIAENIDSSRIFVTGNTVIDSLMYVEKKFKLGYSTSQIKLFIEKIKKGKKLVLVTCHRRENFGEGLINIIQAVKDLSNRDDLQFFWPVHLNPNIRDVLLRELGRCDSVMFTDPLGYIDFIWLLMRCDIIISDSGGIQEEAAYFDIPVLVTRQFTERRESLNNEISFLVGSNIEKIKSTFERVINSHSKTNIGKAYYGDGLSGKRIVDILCRTK